ncbi:MAG TPA: threonine/serine dehydratase [Aliidongia sp.]|uniref:threonine/serine dehydratase n=1 Tax=Aliidongia sp. TaxID=1914230 RepID=UPI002DDD3F15|nr:threonine/serine dehydratase [Aliidongia sp.]HEV2675289.1 threonine/serine dehydratase [Aliidongia sp.]
MTASSTSIRVREIEAAAARIAGHVRETPVLALESGAFDIASPIVLKLESLQHSGSFKARGAFNSLLSMEVPAAGVIAASGGNHGAAVAYAAGRLGHRAEIFVPEIASPVKVRRLRDYGAIVHQVGANYGEAFAASRRRVEETGALTIHAYDQAEVLAGQGTVAREFERQAMGLGGIDTLLIAVGGGGLIGGVAAWCAGRTSGPQIKLIAVEPERCPTLHAAFAAGEPVDVAVGGLAADALGATRVGSLMFPIARRAVDQVILVPDEAIKAAQMALWNRLRLAVEPGGATALSALLAGLYRPAPRERVGVLLCGGNVDPTTLV